MIELGVPEFNDFLSRCKAQTIFLCSSACPAFVEISSIDLRLHTLFRVLGQVPSKWPSDGIFLVGHKNEGGLSFCNKNKNDLLHGGSISR